MEKFLAYFGHLNIDTVLNVEKVAEKGSNRLISVDTKYGGTAGNFAMAASRLGLPFTIFSRVSARTHRDYLTFLNEKGIDTSSVEESENDDGPSCYIVSSGQSQTAYMQQGPMETWDTRVGMERLNEYRYVHFSTGPPSLYISLLDAIKDTQVAFDPSQEIFYRYSDSQITAFLKRADLLFFNEDEFEMLTSSQDKIGRIPDNAKVIVTHGSDGTQLIANGRKSWFRTRKVDSPANTVGAGDVFRAGFYLGVYLNMSIADSIRLGNSAAWIYLNGNGFSGLSRSSLLDLIEK